MALTTIADVTGSAMYDRNVRNDKFVVPSCNARPTQSTSSQCRQRASALTELEIMLF